MPCVACGARSTDPSRGPSPWKRGVLGGRQVLVCPQCQRDPEWASGLDHCSSCASTMLVRALGVTMCRACGTEIEAGDIPVAAPRSERPDIADEVSAALDRVLDGRHR